VLQQKIFFSFLYLKFSDIFGLNSTLLFACFKKIEATSTKRKEKEKKKKTNLSFLFFSEQIIII